MQNKTATQGEINLYKKIKCFDVRASIGNSSAGYGWRPICGGHYLGGVCHSTEKAAITHGKILVDDLKRRVDAAGVFESTRPQPKKRARKAVAK
jgi:hypothetical protein